MSESLVLTFAEVAALAGMCESDRGERVLDLLKVSPEARSTLVRQAGLASLLARDLARANAEDVVLAPGPKLLLDVVTTLGHGFELGVVGREGGDGMIVLDAAGDRMVISPRPYGCYALAGLEPEGDIAAQLAQIVEHLLANDAEAVAGIVALTPDPDPQAIRGGWPRPRPMAHCLHRSGRHSPRRRSQPGDRAAR